MALQYLILVAATLLLSPLSQAPASAAKILLYPFGHCLNSHLLNMEYISEILMSDGHNVSLLISSAYGNYDNKRFGNKHAVSTSEKALNVILFDGPSDSGNVCDIDTMDALIYAPAAERYKKLMENFVSYCDRLLSDKQTLQFLKAQKFDLFMLDTLDPCSRILADYLDILFIPMITTGLGHYDGNPRPPSYIPAPTTTFMPDMTFPQRIKNLVMKLMYDIIPVVGRFDEPFEALKRKHSINTSLSLADTFNRASLKFVNSHFAIEYPAPIAPDTILVGGFSVREPNPLNAELEEFMQNSGDDGVILMTLGTITKRYDARWTKIFADAFARLPQKVIWRYYSTDSEVENSYHFSDNIKRMKWVPQVDILAHNKTRLFISHCGLHGLYETIYYKMPVVALPISCDQFNHAVKLTQYLQLGIQLDIFDLTSDKVYNAIQEVLQNNKYKKNAETTSERIHDMPVSAKDSINYWVSYVIRHKGAPYLKSVAYKLKWYEYLSLDVVGCLLLVFCLAVAVAGFVVYKLGSFMLVNLLIMWKKQKFE